MKNIRILSAAVLLAVAAGSAGARNDRLLLPIAPALDDPATGGALSVLTMQFGRDPSVPLETSGLVEVRGVAVPYSSVSNQYGNSRQYRSDPEVCREAFRKALAELQYRARAGAGKAVVDIVSYYRRQEFNSRDVYECHAGNTRAVVDLRGRISMNEAGPRPVTAPSALTAPLPGAPAPAR